MKQGIENFQNRRRRRIQVNSYLVMMKTIFFFRSNKIIINNIGIRKKNYSFYLSPFIS
jgi:hypothetical protein